MKKNKEAMWSSYLSVVTDDMNPQASTKSEHAKKMV